MGASGCPPLAVQYTSSHTASTAASNVSDSCRARAPASPPQAELASARGRGIGARRHGPGFSRATPSRGQAEAERGRAARRARLQPGERRGRERVRGERGAVQLRAAGRHAQPGAKRLQRLLAAAVRCARSRAPALALGQPRRGLAACAAAPGSGRLHPRPACVGASRRSQRRAPPACAQPAPRSAGGQQLSAWRHTHDPRHSLLPREQDQVRHHAGPAAYKRQACVIRAHLTRSAAAACVRWGRRLGAAHALRDPHAARRRGPPGERARSGAPWCRSRQAARTCSAAGTAPTSSATIARRRSGRTAGR